MKKLFLLILPYFFFFQLTAQKTHRNEIISFQKELNEQYADPEKSPLLSSDLEQFTELNFFPIDKKYRVEAKFQKIFNPLTVTLKTTTDRKPQYVIYAKVTFIIEQSEITLNVYQNLKLSQTEKYKDYLFLPFTDLTNGKLSYGGGRYIDLKLPEDDLVIIDFNKAYNPYCAYNPKYSCVVPPSENDINIEIKAGVKKFKDHH